MSAGALTPDEYSDRAGVAAAARTRGELEKLIVDLPLDQLDGVSLSKSTGRRTTVHTARSDAARSTAIGIFGGSVVGVGNVVASQLRAVACMGGVEIDLRKVEFAASTVTISCVALMGGVNITVPEDVEVQVSGIGIMGGFGHRSAGPGTPGAPTVRVEGVAIMGGVDVRRRPYE